MYLLDLPAVGYSTILNMLNFVPITGARKLAMPMNRNNTTNYYIVLCTSR